MIDEKDFQKRIQKVGELVNQLEQIADPAARTAAKQLVQLLMELHGAGLERMLEVVYQSGEEGIWIIDQLGRDPLAGSLLILYGLHPEELQARVERKLEELRSRFFKMGAEVRIVGVNGGEVRLRASLDGHSCGSTARTVRTMVEEAILEAAPDLTSLVIEGLEEPAKSGFVGVEALLGSSFAQRTLP